MKYKIVAYFVKFFSRLLLLTCRIQVHGRSHFVDTISKGSLIIAFWHDKMALFPKTFESYTHLCRFVALISKSRDAMMLDAIVKSYPSTDTLKVAHDKRSIALLATIDLLKSPNVALMITPDGPRGPRHTVKPGIIAAAQESGCPIIPFRWSSSSSFRLSSWDRFEIPKPFAHIIVHIDPPIYLDKTVPQEQARQLIEEKLNI